MNDPMVNGSRLLRGGEVALMLNVSKAFAYKLMREGKLPTVRMGKSVRVRIQDVITYIDENRTSIPLWK